MQDFGSEGDHLRAGLILLAVVWDKKDIRALGQPYRGADLRHTCSASAAIIIGMFGALKILRLIP